MTAESRERLNRVGGSIAVGLTVLLGFAIAALVYVAVPPDNQNALLVLIGALTTNVTAIVAFFFGSSSSEKKQSETINTLATTAAQAQASLPGAKPAITIPPGDQVTVAASEEPSPK